MARAWVNLGITGNFPIVRDGKVVPGFTIPNTGNEYLRKHAGLVIVTMPGSCRQGRQEVLSSQLKRLLRFGGILSPCRTLDKSYRGATMAVHCNDPTYNAWTGGANPYMGDNRDRTINGYGFVNLHYDSVIAGEEYYQSSPALPPAKLMRDNQQFRRAYVQLLDTTLGQLGVIFSPAGEKKRARRFKPAGSYGLGRYNAVEYRTMSNWWLHHTIWTYLVLGLARDLYAKLYLKEHLDITDNGPDADDIIRAINTGDKDLAKKNWDQVKFYIPRNTCEEVGLTSSIGFVDYMVHNGTDILPENGSAPEFGTPSWEGTIEGIVELNGHVAEWIESFRRERNNK